MQRQPRQQCRYFWHSVLELLVIAHGESSTQSDATVETHERGFRLGSRGGRSSLEMHTFA